MLGYVSMRYDVNEILGPAGAAFHLYGSLADTEARGKAAINLLHHTVSVGPRAVPYRHMDAQREKI